MGDLNADVCVVGAGIVGLAHALEARAKGLTVTVLERHGRCVGASIRNFGHVIVSAMGDGLALECALAARERWITLGRRAGVEVHEAGTLIAARAQDELEVLAGVAADPVRGARMLTAAEVGRLAPLPTDGLAGGLHAGLDLRVDPRGAVAGLAALLEEDRQARVRWNTPVQEVAPGAVTCAAGTVRAEAVIVCPGPDHDWLGPELALTRRGLTRCKLQMLRVAAPGGRRYEPALLTGLSLPRYPGYACQPGAARLAERIAAERPELTAAGVHLIVTQLPGGDLLLGDTHEYGDPVSPFGDERLDELVLDEARRLLGVSRLDVRERWHGIYPWAPGEPFTIEQPLPGVAVVEVVSGIGMTTALGLAPQTFQALDPAPAPVAVRD
jgi:FAD dependent oxidoreductase TIGR03364